MKTLKFCATVAFLCSGSSLFAQTLTVNPTVKSTELRSVLVGSGDSELIQPSDTSLTREPFAQSEIDVPSTDFNYEKEPVSIDFSPQNDPSSISNAETSKPVTTNNPAASNNPVDRIISNGLLVNTPMANGPIAWPMMNAPYNPTAQIMQKNWCTDGLWATYDAERAAQCAQIQAALAGENRRCLSCPNAACAQPACATGLCGQPAPVLNRYRQRVQVAAPCASGTCDQAAPCSTCDQAASLPIPTVSATTNQQNVQNNEPAKPNVALLPTLLR